MLPDIRIANEPFGMKKVLFFSSSTSSIIPDYKEVTHLSHNQAAHLPVRQLQLYLQTEEVDPTPPADEQDGEVLVVVVVMTMMVVAQEVQDVQGQEEEVKKVVQM